MKPTKNPLHLSFESQSELCQEAVRVMKEMHIESLSIESFEDLKMCILHSGKVKVRYFSDEGNEGFPGITTAYNKACKIRKYNPQHAHLSTKEMMEQPWWNDFNNKGQLYRPFSKYSKTKE